MEENLRTEIVPNSRSNNDLCKHCHPMESICQHTHTHTTWTYYIK